MIRNTNEILKKLRSITDKVILFHSATGKDSIVLMDLLYKNDFKIIPVYMYVVKELEYIQRYIKWSEKKYNVTFIQSPHYCLSQYIKHGSFGIKKDALQRIYTIKTINDKIIEQTGIDWTVLGFKKSDGLNRRIMLNELPENNAFHFKTNKCYPLSDWLNKECIAYIKSNNLINPVVVSNSPSQDVKVYDKNYIQWLAKTYPNDLKQVIKVMPEVEAILYSFEYQDEKGN